MQMFFINENMKEEKDEGIQELEKENKNLEEEIIFTKMINECMILEARALTSGLEEDKILYEENKEKAEKDTEKKVADKEKEIKEISNKGKENLNKLKNAKSTYSDMTIETIYPAISPTVLKDISKKLNKFYENPLEDNNTTFKYIKTLKGKATIVKKSASEIKAIEKALIELSIVHLKGLDNFAKTPLFKNSNVFTQLRIQMKIGKVAQLVNALSYHIITKYQLDSNKAVKQAAKGAGLEGY